MPRATSHDVARLAGVSQPTVSRALREDPRVAEATRRRVAAAAAQLGYVASRRGRSLSTRTTGQVAVVVGDLGNAFYTEAIEHLHGELERAEQRMVVLTDAPEGAPATERLLDGSVDGAILLTTLLDSPAPRELADRGLPVVLLNRSVDDETVDACTSANADGAQAAAAQLAALGHERVGAILGPADTSTGRDREAGFRAGLAAHGIALPAARVRRGPFSHDTGHRALGELLAAAERPTAVFCANDVIAIGALNAARGLGVDVPTELTVIGFDDIAMAAWDAFRLTTVRQDLAAMARAAVALLLDRIGDPERPGSRVVVPTRLVLRGSHAARG
ncbi:MAG TPA: LacI family DNA-binding transcriptional regulator [Conexibacter sp.]|jgi:LacI family transcriptional regulator|nr:LacI family DNA-binding transcriptional regulator [Conexibacter sp.]